MYVPYTANITVASAQPTLHLLGLTCRIPVAKVIKIHQLAAMGIDVGIWILHLAWRMRFLCHSKLRQDTVCKRRKEGNC